MDSPAYDLVRVERFVPEPPEELLTEVVSEPRSPVPPAERASFRRKYERGPERFRQAIVNAWLTEFWDSYEALKWLQRAGFVTFAELPKNHEEWSDWLDDYSRRL